MLACAHVREVGGWVGVWMVSGRMCTLARARAHMHSVYTYACTHMRAYVCMHMHMNRLILSGDPGTRVGSAASSTSMEDAVSFSSERVRIFCWQF